MFTMHLVYIFNVVKEANLYDCVSIHITVLAAIFGDQIMDPLTLQLAIQIDVHGRLLIIGDLRV